MPLGAFKAALMGTAGVSTADVVLLHDTDYSGATTASITSGIDSTYGEYIFRFYNINPVTDNATLQFQVNATDDPGGGYDTSLITSTTFVAQQNEAGNDTGFDYRTGSDQAQAAGFQDISFSIGNGGDENFAGDMHLFNPSSTTYVKHFYSRGNSVNSSAYSNDFFAAGYINDTTAIDDIQFKMSSGNFDGTIKMWGVK